MHEPNPLIRLAQRISDAVQDRTGATCLRQAELLDWASAYAILASVTISSLGGTLDGSTSRSVIIVIGAFAMRYILGQDRSDGENVYAGLPLTCWNVTTALANHVGIATGLIAMAWWIIHIGVASRGDLTTDAALAIAVGQAYAAAVLGKRDRAFRQRCDNGELTAPSEEPQRAWALALDAHIGGSLIANAVVHADLAGIAAGVAGTLVIAASLVGRCRPRPPRAKRNRSKAPSRWMATSNA